MTQENGKLQFIYTLEPVDPEKAKSQDGWTDYDRETFALHWANLERGVADWHVIMAGRAQDGIGPAIVVFEADSEEEARRFMERDPFITRGFARGKLHPFRVAISRNEV